MTDSTTDTDTTEGITIVRRFEAPRELVFKAWTDPAQFAHWYGTADMTVEDVLMDVRPGGAWSATMLVGGDMGVIAWSGVYREVDPPSRLVLTVQDRPGPEFELCTVVLTEVDGGTEMVFTQVGGHMDAAGYAGAKAGWESFFADLAGLVEA
jgi:uncharacterized protein YndB with AHSA1/START domain